MLPARFAEPMHVGAEVACSTLTTAVAAPAGICRGQSTPSLQRKANHHCERLQQSITQYRISSVQPGMLFMTRKQFLLIVHWRKRAPPVKNVGNTLVKIIEHMINWRCAAKYIRDRRTRNRELMPCDTVQQLFRNERNSDTLSTASQESQRRRNPWYP